MKSVFSSRIKELREANELSLREMAKDLELSASIICYYESGEKMPSNKNLVKIAKYFNVPIDHLMGMEYVLKENENESYLKDDKLLKIIRRSVTISNFILKSPRTNVRVLEEYINFLNSKKK